MAINPDTDIYISQSSSSRLVPNAGTSGQTLVKKSNADFDAQWDYLPLVLVQPTDPVLDTPARHKPNTLWVDTSNNGWVWKRRTADNTAWVTKVESTGGGGGSSSVWGAITGTLSAQTDLQNVLNFKADLVNGKVPASQLPTGTGGTVADASITTVKIADKNVTLAKVQDVAANRLLGRIGTVGSAQEIAIGENLVLENGQLRAVVSTSGGTTSVSGGNLTATSGYASLEAAFSAVNANGTPPTTLMVNSVVPVTTDLIQPSNIVLFFVGGGRVNRTGTGKLSALNYVCDDEYQICFSGFSIGNLKFGFKMPSRISYCHFGAVANKFGGDIVAAMAGVDTIPAVDLVANALTHTTQDGMPQGTVGYFPNGDYSFSRTWANTKSIGIDGIENNTYWEKGVRLFFPNRGHGIIQKRERNSVTGAYISRTIGNTMRNFEVVQDHRWYTDSTIKIAGRMDFPPSAVNVTANTITLNGHLYDTGEKVFYTVNGSEYISGLNDYTGDYYVIKVDANTIKLARNYDNAMAGTAIEFVVGTNPRSQGVGVHRVVSWEMRYVGGSAISGTHVADGDFGFPLNDGATVTFDDSRSLMVLRERRTATWSSAGGGGSTLTGNFRQSDVGADIVGVNVGIQEAKILTVASGGTSATINVTIPTGFSEQGFYVNTARSLEIVKPIFVLRTYAGATSATGHNSFIHNGKWLQGQQVRFYHPSGDKTQDFYTTISAPSVGATIYFTDPLPERFGGGLLTTCEAQGLAQMTEKVRLNKWSAVHLEEYNYGQVEKVRTKNFAGNGFTITTDPQMQYLKGNANMVTLQDCFSDGCAANGVATTGQDSNACRIINMNVPNTGGYGIRDDSYLGCTINEGHYADCNMGVMWTGGSNSQQLRSKETTKTAIHDVYVEGGTVGFNLGQNTAIFGGVLDCGFHPQSRHSLAMAGSTLAGDIGISGGIGWAGMNKLWSARINAKPANKNDSYFIKAGGNTPVSYDISNDWGIGAGNLGTRGYFGVPNNDTPAPDYILAWDFAKRAVLTRGELQIGDGSGDPNVYSGMISGTAVPTTGSYSRGYIVLNRNYTAGGTFCWVNKAVGLNFEAISIGGTSSGGTSPSSGATVLDGLADVTITSPTDGQVLKYNTATGQWINAAGATGGGGGSSAGLTLDSNAPVGLADGYTVMRFTGNGIRMSTLWGNTIFLGGTNGEGFAVGIGAQYNFSPTTSGAFDLGAPFNRYKRTFSDFVNKTNFTPATSADTAGVVGDEASDDNYFYKKTATGWKRAALTTF